MTILTSSVNELDSFLTRLLSFYLVAIIGYYGISYIAVTEKNKESIVFTLTIVGVFNAVISYLQYVGNPIGVTTALLFSSEDSDYMRAYLQVSGQIQQLNLVVPGIFGHGATNGYMASSLGILPLYFINQRRRVWKIFGVLSFLIALMGSFAVQERAGFGLLLIFTSIIFLKTSHRIISVICIFLIVIVVTHYSNEFMQMLNNDSLGRYSQITEPDKIRTSLMTDAIKFIKQHWLFGGEELYHSSGRMTPHNFFLHSLIFSGIFGFIVISILYVIMLKASFLAVFKAESNQDITLYIGASLCIYLLNSLFHSGSLITGDVLIWILYALLLYKKQKKFRALNKTMQIRMSSARS